MNRLAHCVLFSNLHCDLRSLRGDEFHFGRSRQPLVPARFMGRSAHTPALNEPDFERRESWRLSTTKIAAMCDEGSAYVGAVQEALPADWLLLRTIDRVWSEDMIDAIARLQKAYATGKWSTHVSVRRALYCLKLPCSGDHSLRYGRLSPHDIGGQELLVILVSFSSSSARRSCRSWRVAWARQFANSKKPRTNSATNCTKPTRRTWQRSLLPPPSPLFRGSRTPPAIVSSGRKRIRRSSPAAKRSFPAARLTSGFVVETFALAFLCRNPIYATHQRDAGQDLMLRLS